MLVRIFNYNTMECVHKWEAHQDYIRSIAVHPSLPYLLTSADDMSIKMWDWDQNWNLIRYDFESALRTCLCTLRGITRTDVALEPSRDTRTT